MMNEAPDSAPKPDRSAIDMAALEQDLRARSRDLCAKLTTATGHDQDEHLRQEIAAIAAGMLVLTATIEGAASPIPALLTKREASIPTPAPAKSDMIDKVQAMAPDLIRL
jgi:hypothetical protein